MIDPVANDVESDAAYWRESDHSVRMTARTTASPPTYSKPVGGSLLLAILSVDLTVEVQSKLALLVHIAH